MSKTIHDTASVHPYHLRCESLVTPIGVEQSNPTLSWRMRSDRNGAKPIRHRVAVSSSDLAWDSGWLDFERPQVEFTGELRPRSRYEWEVRIEDEKGMITSATSWFETGLLDRSELIGSWIGRDMTAPNAMDSFDPPQDDDLTHRVRHILPAINLRGIFRAQPNITSARLYASAHGIYEAAVNGLRIGDTELAPGWTDYRDRIFYQAYDISDVVTPGVNAIGMTVADGWWSGYVGFDARRQGNHYGTGPGGWAMVVITYDDGSEDFFATDDSWLESPGTIVYADLLMGQYDDMRRDLGDWTLPEFDDSSWARVRVADTDLSALAAPLDEPVRVLKRVPAKSLTTDPEGRLIADFGQNLVGRISANFGAMDRGQAVYIRHGEILDGEYLYTANLRSAEARDVYVSAGGNENSFTPRFTFHGFRYAEITGAPAHLKAEDLVAEVIYSDTPEEGSIVTSSSDVNQLISNVRWGQRANFVSIPTDCPQRDERLGWTADAQVFTPTAVYNSDVQAFMSRWLGDVRYAQSHEGSFTDVAPVVTQFFADGAPAWADAGTIIPWHLYRVYGDKRLLATSLPSMKRWVDFVHKHNPDLVWTRRVGKHYGDWLQIDAETSRPLLATAYFAHSAELTSHAAKVLGENDAAMKYASLAADIKKVFVENFLLEDGTLESDTQTTYLLALAFDLVPDDLRKSMADRLVKTIERHNGLLTTGFVGVALLCPVLSEIGRSDLAYALLETDKFPSWLYSVRQGATTIWERWDGWTEEHGFQSVEMNSFNHYSLGSVVEWLYRYVAGIDQQEDSVGFNKPLIRPVIGGSLTTATASYETPFGLIKSSWTLEHGNIQFAFTIPPGTSTKVCLPIASATIGGSNIDESPHVSGIERTGHDMCFTLSSGTYELVGEV